MKNGFERKQWVTPVLEKIEISRTNAICPATGTSDKNHTTPESGKCGQGAGS